MSNINCRINCYSGVHSYEVIPGVNKVEDPYYYTDVTFPVGQTVKFRVVMRNHYVVKDTYVYLIITSPDFKQELDYIEFTEVSPKVWELETDFDFNRDGDYAVMVYCRGQQLNSYVDMILTNAVCDKIPGDFSPGETTFNVTCSSDFEFQVLPYVSDECESHYNFEKVDDTTYTITLDLKVYHDYTIYAEAVKKSIVIDRYGMITIYRPTKDELKIISRKRWIKRTYDMVSGIVSESEEYIDTAKFVVSLLKVFLKLESTSQEKLYFGPYDMGINCDVIGNDVVKVDCGMVRICGVHGNSIDYDETEIQAYLPFIGFISLPTSDFMDKEITLEYQVNIINGDGLAVFKANGQVVSSHSCNVSFHIPYQLGDREYQNKELRPNTNYLLNEPPFIYVKTHNALNPDENLPYHETNFYSCFGELSGYTEAKEIDLHIISPQITKQEIDEIKQLLENGVFL